MMDNEIERQQNEKNGQSHVRNPLPEGKTEFSRPMPGAARMYPETDLPLLKIHKSFIDDIKRNLPKLRSDIKLELKQSGLSEEMISLLMKNNSLEEFKALQNLTKDSDLIVKMLVLWPKDFAKKLKQDAKIINKLLTVDVIESVLEALNKGSIDKHDVRDILLLLAEGKPIDEALKIDKKDLNEIEEFVIKLIKRKPGLTMGAYMGLIIKEFKGKVSGKDVMEILNKHIK